MTSIAWPLHLGALACLGVAESEDWRAGELAKPKAWPGREKKTAVSKHKTSQLFYSNQSPFFGA